MARMTINQYLSNQDPEREALLTSLHQVILNTNKKVKAEVGKMMGSEMIQYKINGHFIYALANQKNYISLHAMPIYGHKPLHEKYSKLLKKAKFQKGCINFKNADEIPLDVAEQLLSDCAKIDWESIVEKYQKAKK
jgi:hypothetical protein